MARKVNKTTDLEKIAESGGEAIITAVAISRERSKFYTLNLSDDAAAQNGLAANLALLFRQKEVLQQYWRENNHAPNEPPVAPLEFQELIWELINMSELNLGAHVIMIATDASAYVEKISALEARNLGYPVAEDLRDNDPFLVFYIPRGEKGETGETGETGGTGGEGIQGPQGIQGPPGECEDCQPGGQPDGGGGGPGGGDGGGSGPGGEPNPDGLDKMVYVSGCPDPILDFPYCSPSFSFSNANLRGAIVAACVGTGHFNASTEILVSVVLAWYGAAYAGIAELTVGGEYDYTGPHSNLARVLTVGDAENNTLIVPHTVENFGVEDVLVVSGYHYDGSTGIRMLPDSEPIPLNGQMSTYPILESANCHTPPDASDPAWLKCCLRQFVKRAIPSECPELDADGTYFKVPFNGPLLYPAPYDIRYENFGDYVPDKPAFRNSRSDWNINGSYGWKPLHKYRMHFNLHTNINFEANWALMDSGFNIISDGTIGAYGIPNYNNVGDGGDNYVTVQFGDMTTPSNISECTLYRLYIYYGRGDKIWNIQDIQDLGPI